MLISSIRTQMSIMFKTKEYKAAAWVTFLYACISFVRTINRYCQGVDISQLKDANEYVCYNANSGGLTLLYILFPFLIVLPFATSYVDDYKNKLLPVYISRSSRTAYYISKLISCFIGTAFAIAIPLLINLLLCNIFLPHNNNSWIGAYPLTSFYEDLLGRNLRYSTAYPKLSFLHIFMKNPFLYNFMYLIFFSLFAGLLATFVLSISFVWNKRKLILFLPVFILMQTLNAFDIRFLDEAVHNNSFYMSIDMIDYVIPFESGGKNPFFFISCLVIIFAVIIGATLYAVKNDLRSIQ